MRITFTQSGGFAGRVRGCRIDTAVLSAEERRTLESLVATSGLDASFTRVAEASRDRKCYEIRIERGGVGIEVTCDDASLPAAARPLVANLAARAVPCPPGWADAGGANAIDGNSASGNSVRETSAGGNPAGESGPGMSPVEWGRFDGVVVARWHDDGREMTLVEPFAYVDPRGCRWEAAAGVVVNGATIPRAFWSLIGGPFEGRFRNASVVHDAACITRTRDWQATHRMFYEACRCGGVDTVMAHTMYFAVWHFGPRWRIEERTAVVAGRSLVERIVHDETPPPPTAAEVDAVATYFRTHDVASDAIPTLVIPGVRGYPCPGSRRR